MFLRPGLAGHHPQLQQEGGATGDQYCPSDPLLLGHAHQLHQNMQALFGALAEAEEQQTYLHDLAVSHRTRRLAGHHLGDYGPA
ncbi:hypothetical protein Celaphus_00015810 [Cervus elaphus hippelaphus]|uniref:Uncharacterized protein n=1 Tax=Cervus elaphus hippelaphus TaxID=46360 RepID=A0A212C2I5_CEREH|nr:hypothetical protein Celaphus_00015810 [Cervus elaphus hippelaphus]